MDNSFEDFISGQLQLKAFRIFEPMFIDCGYLKINAKNFVYHIPIMICIINAFTQPNLVTLAFYKFPLIAESIIIKNTNYFLCDCSIPSSTVGDLMAKLQIKKMS